MASETSKVPSAGGFHHLTRFICSTPESNLLDKSKLYEDSSLKHIFLMNNIHYMLQKIENYSELRHVVGAQWTQRNLNFWRHAHAMMYLRSTWGLILSLLKTAGLYSPGSSSISRRSLKEWFQAFNTAFEKVYESQTAYYVVNDSAFQSIHFKSGFFELKTQLLCILG